MEKSNIIQAFIDSLVMELLQALKPQLEDLKQQQQPKLPEELLTRQETCEMLKINLSTLWLWTKKNRLKSHGIGNRVYYKRSEVQASVIALNPSLSKTSNTNKRN